jgi:predicted Co/Zn/Cd cation transporter (cation efflux family)
MLVITCLIKHEDNGNVLPVLAITVYGGVINLIFWIRYARLNKAMPNGILAVQVRLYRAKTLIDASVAIALLPVFIVPESTLSYWFDIVGSVIVALYLIWSGVRTIYKQGKIQDLLEI